MARLKWLDNIIEKLNPAQDEIFHDFGETHETTTKYTVKTAYYDIDVINRGVDLCVDSAANLKFEVANKLKNVGVIVPSKESRFTKERLNTLLNFKPNPYQNIDLFKRELYLDLLLEGNMFIYFDGMNIFHLPACNVKIIADKRTFIKGYEYNLQPFKVEEIIHIKDNSAKDIFRGDSRLLSALPAINSLSSMLSFQRNFFNNNAIPGLILTTPNTLSRKIKDRIVMEWIQRFNPRTGGKRPVVLDGDFDIKNLGHTDFRELDFKDSIETQEKKILKALGVPPILLDSGNNANITPNQKMFYMNTIMPMVNKLVAGLEFFFGYDIKPDTHDVWALRPELKEEADYYGSLVTKGLLTINEGREALRYPRMDDPMCDEIILPANIAGSAQDPTQGGRPSSSDDGEDK